MEADISPLKRTFAEAAGLSYFNDSTSFDEHGRFLSFVTPYNPVRPLPSPTKRRSLSSPRANTMPANPPPAIPQTNPSFQSVFKPTEPGRADPSNSPDQSSTLQYASIAPPAATNTQNQHNQPRSSLSRHTSIDSFMSDSTDSSPTLTTSTFDSPSVTEESPSSSPESPVSSAPLASFGVMMRPPKEPQKEHTEVHDRLPERQHFPLQQISQSPSSDSPTALGRNVKKLSLTVPAATGARPATVAGIETSHPFSAPSSPLPEPLRTGRRKPANLSIQTPSADQLTFGSRVPATPGRPFLPYNQSTPSIVSLTSPTTAPTGGLQLPFVCKSGEHSRATSQSSWSSQSATSGLNEVKEEDQPQRSQEVQERGYVDGPVLIYDCGVYLYLEPTLDEARGFDTVINCAKEIRNPFDDVNQSDETMMSLWRNEADRSRIPEPQTAMSELSFKSAFEWPQPEIATRTPTTPKQHNTSALKQPEYLHVPWDHNSEIVEDLYPLCKLIDDRVAAGKTVLVHCQLGVSRSASLVIAYGLYKGYQSTFHTMYNAVKARSKWVGPNMSLIYQLGDFRGQVARGDFAERSSGPPNHWFKTSQAASDLVTPTVPTVVPAITPTPTRNISSHIESDLASQPPIPSSTMRLNKALPPVPLCSEASPAEKAAAGNKTDLSFPKPRVSAAVAPRPLPLRQQYPVSSVIPPHRSRNRALPAFSIVHPLHKMDLAKQDVPSTPSLFSPKVTEFIATPLGTTLAGDLHSQSRAVSQSTRTPVDPRSPDLGENAEQIMGHIDDYL